MRRFSSKTSGRVINARWLELYALGFFVFVFLLGCAVLPRLPRERVPEKDLFRIFPEKYQRRAIAYEKEGELPKALLSWQVVHRFRPDDTEVLEKITVLKGYSRSEADKHFLKGLDYFHNNAMRAARKEFLMTLAYVPDHERAKDYLKHTLAEPDYVVYQANKGDTLRKIADKIYQDSEKAFLIAYLNDLDGDDPLKHEMTLRGPVIESALLTAQPDYSEVMLNKARALFKVGKYRKALCLAEDVLEYSPTNSAASDLINSSYYALGTILLRQEKYQEALQMFKNADITNNNVAKIVSDIKKRLQNEAQTHYRKGVEYFLAEQLDQAIKEWEETLRLNPDHRDAKRDLNKTRRLLENLRKLP